MKGSANPRAGSAAVLIGLYGNHNSSMNELEEAMLLACEVIFRSILHLGILPYKLQFYGFWA